MSSLSDPAVTGVAAAAGFWAAERLYKLAMKAINRTPLYTEKDIQDMKDRHEKEKKEHQ